MGENFYHRSKWTCGFFIHRDEDANKEHTAFCFLSTYDNIQKGQRNFRILAVPTPRPFHFACLRDNNKCKLNVLCHSFERAGQRNSASHAACEFFSRPGRSGNESKLKETERGEGAETKEKP